MYRAEEVAEYIVTYCAKNRTPISHLKLQKMLYYAWIDYYKCTGHSLFREDICAWQLGPVVPEVYYAFSAFGGLPITHEFHTNINPSDAVILSTSIQQNWFYSAKQLVDKSHTPGGAWARIYQGGLGIRKEIPKALIAQIGY